MHPQPTANSNTQVAQGSLFVQLPRQLPIYKQGPEDEPKAPTKH